MVDKKEYRDKNLALKGIEGFTIVELLVVIVVIAILAAITIVSYNGITNSAEESRVGSYLQSSAQAVTSYRIKNPGDQFPNSLADAGITTDPSLTASYTYDNSAKTFCISVKNSKNVEKYITSSGPISLGNCLSFGLVGRWNFNGNANDSSGNGINGIVSGAVLTTGQNGATNGAYRFGPTSSISIGSGENYKSPSATVSLWIKRDDTSSDNFTLLQTPSFRFGLNSSKQMTSYNFTTGSSSGSSGFGSTGFIGTDWIHLVYVLDGPNKIGRYYQNGAQAGSDATLTGNVVITTGGSDYTSYIGARTWPPFYTPSMENFLGVIDDVRYYGRVLSASEVLEIYTAGAE